MITRAALMMTSDETWAGVDILVCPSCGCTEVHLNEVMLLGPNDTGMGLTITNEETGPVAMTMTPDRVSQSTRRQSVVLRGWCERGCALDFEFAQHKGSTFVTTSHDKHPEDAA